MYKCFYDEEMTSFSGLFFVAENFGEKSELKGTLRKRHEKKEGNKKFSEQSNGRPLQNNNVKWPSSVLS